MVALTAAEVFFVTGVCPQITFHKGSVYEESVVVKLLEYGGRQLVVAAETPFHPRDYQWPDQPADRGFAVNAAGGRFSVIDAVFTATDGSGGFFTDAGIPVKKGEPGWRFCVGHVLEGVGFAEGDKIILEADGEYRGKLSRAHSAAHVMSLALNMTLAPFWSKPAALSDPLGSPNFDSLAMARSSITEDFVTDQYRMGKSLRKKGFSAKELGAALEECEEGINALLVEWLSADAPVAILAPDGALGSRRLWRSEIAGRRVEIPCGGTHVRSLSEIGAVRATLEMPDEETLVIRTGAGG